MPTLGFRRHVVLIIGLLFGLLIISVNSSTLTASAKIPTVAKMPTATKVVGIDLETMCKNVLDRAVELTQQNCESTGRNQACYGYTQVNSELRSGEDSLPNQFDRSGDILGLRYFSRIRTEPLNPVSGSWGMAVMKLQANLPDTNPGQNVTFILFGDTDLRPDLDRTNSFYLSTDLGSLTCRTLPSSSMIVRAPKGMTVEFTLNDVQIKIASIVLLRNDNNQLLVRGLEGHMDVTSFGVQRSFSAGQQVTVPMLGVAASGAPSQPQNAPFEQPLDNLGRLIISMDSSSSDFAGDITLTGRVDAINAGVPSITLGGYLVRVGGVSGWQSLAVGDEVSVLGSFESYYVIARRITRLEQIETPSSTPATSTSTASATGLVPTATHTFTALPTHTSTPTPSVTYSVTPTRTLTATYTATDVPTDTPTPLPTHTRTPQPTATDTPLPTASNTPAPSDTPQPTDTSIPPPAGTNTPHPSDTPQPAATDTKQPTETEVPPTITNTPHPPTRTPRSTRTPRPTRRPSATPAPTNTVAPFVDVQLSALCSSAPSILRRWSISNPNDEWVSATWVILGSPMQGIVVLPPHTSISFSTLTQQSSNVMQLTSRGRVVATQPSISEPCFSPSSVPPTATPTDTPTEVPTNIPSTPAASPATSEATSEPTSTSVPAAASTPQSEPPPAPDGGNNSNNSNSGNSGNSGNDGATSMRIFPIFSNA